MASDGPKVMVENANIPGYRTTVDAAKYHAMCSVLLSVLPDLAPGLTQGEIAEAVQPHLSAELFPDGNKVMWWVKAVQLDLEAKGTIRRERTRPMRWYRPARP